MSATSFHLFDTAIGRCGVVWGERGIVGLNLPGPSDDQTRARIRRRHPGATEAAPTADAQRAIDGIAALLAGEPRDLSSIALDFDGVPDFHRRVYEVARSIPPGETLTYGDVAHRLGDPLRARAVGQALAQNPFAIVVPCHRVMAAGGKTGGFSAPGGIVTKLRLLEIEGARASGIPTLFR